MKTRFPVVLLLLTLALTPAWAQSAKYRASNPVLNKNGTVTDQNGTELGYITRQGKVCDVTGNVLGIIAKGGSVTTADGKGILGWIQRDGSFKSNNGVVVSMSDGMLMSQGKMVGKYDKAYKYKNHACLIHCFFSSENQDAGDIDKQIEEHSDTK